MDFLLELNGRRIFETLLGVVAGGLISTVTAFFVAKWQSEKAFTLQQDQQKWANQHQLDQYAEERKLQREQIAFERAIEADRYQRETLGELQTVLDELVKTARAVAIEKREIVEKATPEEIKSDNIQTSEYYQQIAERFRAANARTKVLGARVSDPEVLDLLNRVYPMAFQFFDRSSLSWSQLDQAGKSDSPSDFELVDLADEANTVIGRKLRERAQIDLGDDPQTGTVEAGVNRQAPEKSLREESQRRLLGPRFGRRDRTP
jgi:gas vesicle protein